MEIRIGRISCIVRFKSYNRLRRIQRVRVRLIGDLNERFIVQSTNPRGPNIIEGETYDGVEKEYGPQLGVQSP